MVCVDTSSSCLSTIESREFQENGLKMTLVHTSPGHPDIRSVRVYMKVTMGMMGKNPTLGLYADENGKENSPQETSHSKSQQLVTSSHSC